MRRKKLNDETVCVSLDGWAVIHNEPVVCVAVTHPKGETYITDIDETYGIHQNADCLETVEREAINSAETKYGRVVW